MREMVSQMLKLDPSLYKEFSEEALFLQPVDFSKSSLIEGMGVLEPEKLISFMTNYLMIFWLLLQHKLIQHN